MLGVRSTSVRAVRINAVTSRDGIHDLALFTEHSLHPDIVILPKVSEGRDVQIVDELLATTGWRGHLFAVIETPRAARQLDEIATAGGSLSGLIFGSADMFKNWRIEMNSRGRMAGHLRAEIAAACAAYDLLAIDSPCFAMADGEATAELADELAVARELGFAGKIAIHPAQVPCINEAFTPAEGEVQQAIKIVESAGGERKAIVNLNGQMIGPPFVHYAKQVLSRLSQAQGAT
jgi:citrate lyase beta subunit